MSKTHEKIMHFVAAKMIGKKTVAQEEKHPCFDQLFFVNGLLKKSRLKTSLVVDIQRVLPHFPFPIQNAIHFGVKILVVKKVVLHKIRLLSEP